MKYENLRKSVNANRSFFRPAAALLALFALGGCSGSSPAEPPAAGGGISVGGSSNSSGTGGASTGGGSSGNATGGTTTAATGGTTQGNVTGGQGNGTGGASIGTGGKPGTGGAGAGGVSAATGGSATGGAQPTGGTTSKGGSSATGGTTSKGGSTAATGGAATGGATTAGGASSVGGLTTCTVENCGTSCAAPTMPAYSALTANAMLPDPFMMTSGTRITKLSDWECRRAEIAAQLQNYELGLKNPKAVDTVTGSVSGSTLTVTVGGQSFTVTITLPTTGTAPYPAIIALDGGSLPASSVTGLGVALISLSTTTMGDQTSAASRGSGFFFTVNGSDNGAGSLIAWAWGASRIIDALEVTPSAKIDPKRIGVTGCSRNGKGALVMGAFDERVALTIVQESGSGGTASWRVSDAEDGGTNTVQTLGEIVGEDDWFSTALNIFATNKAATKLPYDHHELLGMVAPRGLFIIENTSYQWLGVNSCVTDATAAQMVFQGLNVKPNVGFTNSAHSHCVFNTAEAPYLNAFIQKFLLGQSVDTTVWHITATTFSGSTTPVDMTKWVNWTVPTLN